MITDTVTDMDDHNILPTKVLFCAKEALNHWLQELLVVSARNVYFSYF